MTIRFCRRRLRATANLIRAGGFTEGIRFDDSPFDWPWAELEDFNRCHREGCWCIDHAIEPPIAETASYICSRCYVDTFLNKCFFLRTLREIGGGLGSNHFEVSALVLGEFWVGLSSSGRGSV
jgi:hypothetical protein